MAAGAPLLYRPEIDGLRALAVLLVVFYHAAPGAVPGGFIGVDIFFVISGYLITGIIVHGLRSGSFSVSGFYARRCLRILPALFVMMLVVCALGSVLLLPHEFRDLGRAVLAGASFTENALLLDETGYFDIAAIRKPMLHLWSLAVEEQFYILWPLLLWACHRGSAIARMVPVAAAASFMFSAYYFDKDPAACFYILPSRFWELLCGALLATAQHNLFQIRIISKTQSTAALLLVIITAFLLGRGMLLTEWGASVSACVAALLLLSAGRDDWCNRYIFSTAPAIFVGRVSYPFYLWHWPLLSIAAITEGREPSLSIRLGAVALAFMLAVATYRWVERPLQAAAQKVPRRRVLIVSCVGACIVGLLGYGMSAGLVRPFATHVASANDIDAASLEQAVDYQWWKEHGLLSDADCRNSTWPGSAPVDFCRLTSVNPHIALVGDSHANHLVPGLASLSGDGGVVQVSYSGCGMLLGLQPLQRAIPDAVLQGCDAAMRGYYEKIRNSTSIRTVIITQAQITDAEAPADTATTQRLTKKLSQAIASLEAAGKQVVLFIDVPHFDFNPMDCVSLHPFSLSAQVLHNPCAVPVAQVRAEQSGARRIIDALVKENPALRVYDPLPYFCDEHYCYAIRDRKMLYRDGDHLSVDGSMGLANDFYSHLHKFIR